MCAATAQFAAQGRLEAARRAEEAPGVACSAAPAVWRPEPDSGPLQGEPAGKPLRHRRHAHVQARGLPRGPALPPVRDSIGLDGPPNGRRRVGCGLTEPPRGALDSCSIHCTEAYSGFRVLRVACPSLGLAHACRQSCLASCATHARQRALRPRGRLARPRALPSVAAAPPPHPVRGRCVSRRVGSDDAAEQVPGPAVTWGVRAARRPPPAAAGCPPGLQLQET